MMILATERGEKRGDYVVHPELFRLLGYIGFWFIVGLGFVITRARVTEDLSDTTFVQTFGYNNICVFWDYSPAREIVALFYPLCEVPLMFYIITNFLSHREHRKRGELSSWHYMVSCATLPVELVLMVLFRMTFIIASAENVTGKTLGFLGWQVCLALVALKNTCFNLDMGHRPFESIFGATGTLYMAYGYVASLSLVTVLNILQSLGMLCFGRGIFGIHSHVGVILDASWMLLATALPLLFSMSMLRRHAPLRLSFSVPRGGLAAALQFPDPFPQDTAVNPELFRLVGYLGFWCMVLLAIFVTKGVMKMDLSDTPLMHCFGYNNICVYWDYHPSREITAMFYPVVEVPLMLYIIMLYLAHREHWKVGRISDWHYYAAAATAPIEFLLLVCFRMIFVVGAFENVVGHTAGFVGMQLALAMLAAKNTAFAHSLGHRPFQEQFGERGTLLMACCYVAGLYLVTAVKITNTAGIFIRGHGLFSVATPEGIFRATLVDHLWMLFAAVLPVTFAYDQMRKTPAVNIAIGLLEAGEGDWKLMA